MMNLFTTCISEGEICVRPGVVPHAAAIIHVDPSHSSATWASTGPDAARRVTFSDSDVQN